MSDFPSDPPFVPPEKRKSNNIGIGDYAGKLAKAALITKGAAVAGGLIGDKAGGPIGAALGYTLAGAGAVMYEGHQHWKPIKDTQLRVEAMLPEIVETLHPDRLKEETALQTEIAGGLAEREKLFTEMVRQRKSNPLEPRVSAIDALAKEAQSVDPDGKSR